MTKSNITSLEEKLAAFEKNLEEAMAEPVIVRDEKERGIDAYMETVEFKELMEDHDALIHLVSFREGWDEAIKAILKFHPRTFEASAFPCPLAPQPSKAVAIEEAFLLEEKRSPESGGSSDLREEEPKRSPTKNLLLSLVLVRKTRV